jgi:uncharacterized protein
MNKAIYRVWHRIMGNLPKLDGHITVITIVSTLLIFFAYSFTFTQYGYVERMLEYSVIPILIIWLFWRESPAEYGIRLGDWRAGLIISAIAMALSAPLLYWVVKSSPAMQAFYGKGVSPIFFVPILIEMIGWEFICRGWILFGYEKKFGANAIWLQAVPFAFAHLGKPSVEAFSTIFGGFIFGWIAWRTRSYLYPFLIHSFVTIFTILVASGVI